VTGVDLLQAETCRLEAWPAVHTERLSGWILRAMIGGYSRTNSVWPARFDHGTDLRSAIDDTEAFYSRRGLTPCFQVLRIARPEGLDAALASRGYVVEAPCLTMAKDVDSIVSRHEVDITEERTAVWLGLYEPTLSKSKACELPGILDHMPSPRAFALFRIEGIPAGIGLGVKVGNDVSVDRILTVEGYRRRGVARQVLAALEIWSSRQGARRMVLSVVAENRQAVRLYEKLGFGMIGGYHYRVLGPSRRPM
jgi:GNAT superfamily N-acetyltransferase